MVSHSMSSTWMPISEGFLLFLLFYFLNFHFKENLSELQPCGETDSWVPETLETVFLSFIFCHLD